MKNDCVPYAIHCVSGLDYEFVLYEAKRRGWSENDGMHALAGWHLMRDLGLKVSGMIMPERRTTITRFLPKLNVHKRYIIDVTGHWFAFHCGKALDPVKTHPRTEVQFYIEIECPKYCWCRDYEQNERAA